MSLNLYDVLDVSEDATTDEIRAAWKAAIADLDPTDRRFRAYNSAASRLLDGDRRAAYDAERAAERGPRRAAAEADAEPAIVIDEVEGDQTSSSGPRGQCDLRGRRGRGVDDETDEADETTTPRHGSRRRTKRPTTSRGQDREVDRADDAARAVPDWALGAVGVLAVLSLALAVWVATWPGTFGDPSPGERKQDADGRDVQRSGRRTDHRGGLPTTTAPLPTTSRVPAADDAEACAKDRAGVMGELRPEAKSQRAVVVAAVRGTGIASLSPDGSVAQVVVFVDQLVQKAARARRAGQTRALRLIRDDGPGCSSGSVPPTPSAAPN